MSGWKAGEVERIHARRWLAVAVRRDASGNVVETAAFEDMTANGAIRSRDRFLNQQAPR